MGKCNICGSSTPYQCRCATCKSGRLDTLTFYCSSVCRIRDKEQHNLDMASMISSLTSTTVSGCSSDATIIHTSWQGDDESVGDQSVGEQNVGEKRVGENRVGENRVVENRVVENRVVENRVVENRVVAPVIIHDESSTSPEKTRAPCKRKDLENKQNPTKKKNQKKETTEDLAAKAKVRSSKQLTLLFNKGKSKIGMLEPLTPTWSWVFNVEKNSENTRSSKHKYQSPPKLQDMTRTLATNRLSRLWTECMAIVTDIEALDPAFKVILSAKKPENECYARFGKHHYETKDPNSTDLSVEQENSLVSSQELSQGSMLSQASSEVVPSDSEVSIECRVCKDHIEIDNVQEYTACTEPNGNPHFAAHFVCLGLFPKLARDRKCIKSATKCPRHC